MRQAFLDERRNGSVSTRLFFALWPTGSVCAALAAMASACHVECGGRAVPAANLHLTLAFLGNVALARMGALIALADAISGRRFRLCIDRHGYWRHNRVVWAGSTECPDALCDLAEQVSRSMRLNGFRYEERRYAPHITLVRDARRAPAAAASAPVVWDVEDFVLVRSAPGRRTSAYEIVQRWPLQHGR